MTYKYMLMPPRHFTHRCHLCGATSFRQVVARDEHGAMRATRGCLCSGCKKVFADSHAWRGGDAAARSSAAPSSADLSRIANSQAS